MLVCLLITLIAFYVPAPPTRDFFDNMYRKDMLLANRACHDARLNRRTAPTNIEMSAFTDVQRTAVLAYSANLNLLN
jgi:hypothetical protein